MGARSQEGQILDSWISDTKTHTISKCNSQRQRQQIGDKPGELKLESQFSFHSYFSGTSAILFLFTKAKPLTVGKKEYHHPLILSCFTLGKRLKQKQEEEDNTGQIPTLLIKGGSSPYSSGQTTLHFPSLLLLAVALLPSATSSAFAKWVMRSRGVW